MRSVYCRSRGRHFRSANCKSRGFCFLSANCRRWFATSFVLTAGAVVTEFAVGLAVAAEVAVSIFLRLVRLLATGAEAALNVVQWPSLSQITAGEGLWCRR